MENFSIESVKQITLESVKTRLIEQINSMILKSAREGKSILFKSFNGVEAGNVEIVINHFKSQGFEIEYYVFDELYKISWKIN